MRLGLLLAAVVVAAIAANIALLSIATGSHEPVGKLSPVIANAARSRPLPRPTRSQPPVPTGITQAEHQDADD